MEPTVRNETTGRTQAPPSREILWAPVIVATSVSVPLLALSAAMWLVALTLSGSARSDLPPHVTFLEPSGWDLTVGIASHVVPLIAGAALLVLTWIYGLRGHGRRSWICGIVACLVSIGTVL